MRSSSNLMWVVWTISLYPQNVHQIRIGSIGVFRQFLERSLSSLCATKSLFLFATMGFCYGNEGRAYALMLSRNHSPCDAFTVWTTKRVIHYDPLMMSQKEAPILVQEITTIRDFRFRNPRYFVIHFQA